MTVPQGYPRGVERRRFRGVAIDLVALPARVRPDVRREGGNSSPRMGGYVLNPAQHAING